MRLNNAYSKCDIPGRCTRYNRNNINKIWLPERWRKRNQIGNPSQQITEGEP